LRPQVIGRRLLLALEFATGDAIGINMAARAAELVSQLLAQRTAALARAVHGEDVEKRANARALGDGRGRSVVCDVTIPRAALAEHARTTPEALVELWHTYQIGFAHLGTHNWCVQSANGLAALLVACGQDVAYLTECANGFLDLDRTAGGDLYASATLPSLLWAPSAAARRRARPRNAWRSWAARAGLRQPLRRARRGGRARRRPVADGRLRQPRVQRRARSARPQSTRGNELIE
jgi:hypothetical protein